MSLVSVIIPTYNRKLQVLEAVESVLSQTRSDLEVVVIDDGSTDGTAEAVNSIDDTRVRYFYKDNGGVSSARNMGLDKAVGHYLAFLDSDDLHPPDYLETMVSALEQNPDYGIAFATVINHYPNGRTKPYLEEHYCSGWITEEYFHHCFMLCQGCVLERSVANGLFFDEQLTISEDIDFLLRLTCRAQILHVSQTQVIRRVQHASLSREDGIHRKNVSGILVIERFYEEMGAEKWLLRKMVCGRLSRRYRNLGRDFQKAGARKAALTLLAKALQLNPTRLKIYINYALAYLMIFRKDTMPDWEFPTKLDPPKRAAVPSEYVSE